jgi:hypothetical protein
MLAVMAVNIDRSFHVPHDQGRDHRLTYVGGRVVERVFVG